MRRTLIQRVSGAQEPVTSVATAEHNSVPERAGIPRTTGLHAINRWAVLALLGGAQLMVTLDVTIVQIALPSARHAAFWWSTGIYALGVVVAAFVLPTPPGWGRPGRQALVLPHPEPCPQGVERR